MPGPTPYTGSNCGPDCPICYGQEALESAYMTIANNTADIYSGTLNLPEPSSTWTYDPMTNTYSWQVALNGVYVSPQEAPPLNPVQWMSDLVAGFRAG